MNDWQGQLEWNAIAYAAVGGAGVVALAALFVLVPGLRQRWLPLERFPPGRWTGHDVFLAFCVFVGFPQIITSTLLAIGFFEPLLGAPPLGENERTQLAIYHVRASAIASPLTLTVSLGFVIAILFARAGARPHHYGLTWSRWPANVALGIVAFLVMRPIIIGIYALALLIFPMRTDLFEELAKQNLPGWEWALFAFLTSVSAPLLEEILCRGLLQSWLRRATLIGHVTFLFTSIFLTVLTSSNDLTHHDGIGPLVFIAVLAAGYGFWLFRLHRQFDLDEDEARHWQPRPRSTEAELSSSGDEDRELRLQMREVGELRLRSWREANARLAIFGSSLLFASLHANWPAPLALLPMALVLGWLFHRTQSLIGPITFHALFNLSTFIALYGWATS